MHIAMRPQGVHSKSRTYNNELHVHNVFKVKISKKHIKSLESFYKTNVKNNINNTNFKTVYPEGAWNSDIKWISVNNLVTYKTFLDIFKSIDLHIFNQIIDLRKEIR